MNTFKDENYINIQGWMITKLKLSGNELLLFSIIHGFSQDNESWFTGSLSYLCSALNCSRPTVINTINKLIEKKLIIKIEFFQNGIKFCKYATFMRCKETLLVVKKLYWGSKETLLGSKETLLGGSKETLPNSKSFNNKEYNKIDNKEYTAQKSFFENSENLDFADNENLDFIEAEKDFEKKEKSSAKKEKNANAISDAEEVLNYLNEMRALHLNSKIPFKATSKGHISHINARLKDYTVQDLKRVIELKMSQWAKDPKMSNYLTPDTLFSEKNCEKYVIEVETYINNPKKIEHEQRQQQQQQQQGNYSNADLLAYIDKHFRE